MGALSLPVQLLCPEPAQPALAAALDLHREALAAWDNQANWKPELYFERVRALLAAQTVLPLSPAWCASIDDDLAEHAAADALITLSPAAVAEGLERDADCLEQGD